MGGGCIYGDEGTDEVYLLRDVVLTARNNHQCDSCKRTIQRGERFCFEQTKDLEDGKIYTHKMCMGCDELGAKFACDGYLYNPVESIIDHFNDDPENESVGCYDGLGHDAIEVMEQCIWPFLGEAKER